MQGFARLYRQLDETTKTNEKLEALCSYFSSTAAADIAWSIYFLTGRRFKRLIKTAHLRLWATEYSGIPPWLFEECYDTVGDLAETIALLLPPCRNDVRMSLSQCIKETVLPLRTLGENDQKSAVLQTWDRLGEDERFVWNKIITGGFRVGVSQILVTRALSDFSGIDSSVIAHRLMGDWKPSEKFYEALLSKDTSDACESSPYPFYLAYPLDGEPEELGNRENWQVEWKWDGIRAQLIKRNGKVFIWSRGEELVSDRFPEILDSARNLNGNFVIDGEILPWSDGSVLPFAKLQQRIGRKNVSKKILREVPTVLLAFDLLEFEKQDIRTQPLIERRTQLEALLTDSPGIIRISPLVQEKSWNDLRRIRDTSRQRNVEGLMLKERSTPYEVGRKKGSWWKWKIDPYTVDAVLIYAQRGHGKRASLYTDYTFAVWDRDQLVPFAKAYSGLTNEEISRVDRFVRTHTIERFGPVRSVTPELVFELAFESIQHSSRHKSGVAVRFPRIQRWRKDKKIIDADHLVTLKELIQH